MKKTFTIQCEMDARWFPYFLSMIRKMESNGNVGHSCMVGIYADGDGDFRPKFIVDGKPSLCEEYKEIVLPITEINVSENWTKDGYFFDAG